MPRSRLRFVLVQARNPGDRVRAEERDAFAARLGVDPAQVRQVNMLDAPVGVSDLRGADMLLVGGSGEYSVLDDHDGIRSAKELLAEVAALGFPTFASCFGFQLMVEGMGGRVVTDEANAEVGTYLLERTPEADDDPLFKALPPRFFAQLGHKDRAEVMPAGALTLARSERVAHQALRVAGTAVYASQFHPELTMLDNRGRFERYYDHYAHVFGEEGARRKLAEGFHTSPESSGLLDRYVRLFFLDEDPAR